VTHVPIIAQGRDRVMDSALGSLGGSRWGARLWAALALAIVATVAGCNAVGTGKSGGAPEAASQGTITLTFGTADPTPVDTAFATLVSKLSGGRLRLRTVFYNSRLANADQTVAADLKGRKLDVADVGSRAWESLGVLAFRAYQDPFLVSSRELLDNATTGPAAAVVLASLKQVGITGLAIAPTGVRYLYSTRPLTTPAQFAGARIWINASATTSEILTALGSTPVTNMAFGQALQALRDGALTAMESDPQHAMVNGISMVKPYVVVNAPLFGKTTTFAANSASLAKLPASDGSWLRQAAQRAAAAEATSAADRTAWGSLCGSGLKPLAITTQQFNVLHAAEAATYSDVASDPLTSMAVGRIGAISTSEPRLDAWATCHGVGGGSSPTKVLDGAYSVFTTQAAVDASGDCTNCGNAGSYELVIDDGRYTLYHPIVLNSQGSSASNPPGRGNSIDPAEVGTISVTGNRATFVPEISQANGSVPQTFSFELFRGLLSWHLISGQFGWDTHAPWQKLS
jgi:TRAP-type C4-dicarboxylate transport system substrate-binding protein